MVHMTVGALWSIFSGVGRSKFEAMINSYHEHPLLCGMKWGTNAVVSNFLISEDGGITGGIKITCPECIKALKENGL